MRTLCGFVVIVSIGYLIILKIWQSQYRFHFHILYGTAILIGILIIYQIAKKMIGKIRSKIIPIEQQNFSEFPVLVSQEPDYKTLDDILGFYYSRHEGMLIRHWSDPNAPLDYSEIDRLKTNYLYCYTNCSSDFQPMLYDPNKHKHMKERDLPANWDDLRKQVLRRDQYRCILCGEENLQLQVHHIRFRIHGGDDNMDNLVSLCRHCHNTLPGHGVELKDTSLQWSHRNHPTFMWDQNEKIIQHITEKNPQFTQRYITFRKSEGW